MGSNLHKSIKQWFETRLTSYIRKRYRAILVVCLVIVLISAFLFAGNGIVHSIKLHRQITLLEAQNDSLRAVSEWRRQRLELLKKDDPRTIEEEARQHNMKYPGETIFLINPPEDDPDD